MKINRSIFYKMSGIVCAIAYFIVYFDYIFSHPTLNPTQLFFTHPLEVLEYTLPFLGFYGIYLIGKDSE